MVSKPFQFCPLLPIPHPVHLLLQAMVLWAVCSAHSDAGEPSCRRWGVEGAFLVFFFVIVGQAPCKISAVFYSSVFYVPFWVVCVGPRVFRFSCLVLQRRRWNQEPYVAAPTYLNWQKNEPNNYDGDEDCGFVGYCQTSDSVWALFPVSNPATLPAG